MSASMNQYKSTGLFLFLLLGISNTYPPYIQWGQWKNVGLSTMNVTSVVYSSKINKLICGTSSNGLFLLDTATGETKQVAGIPNQNIFKIVETGNGDIYLIAANKVYFCKLKTQTPPVFECKEITLINNIQGKQALAVASGSFDTLYIGAGNFIYSCIKDTNNLFAALRKIPTPLNSFGTVNPLCTDMLINSKTGKLLAGGCDNFNPQSGCEGKKGKLLELNGDSMTIVMDTTNVTTITEFKERDNSSINFVFANTAESTVFYSDDFSKKIYSCISIPKIEPVREMVTMGFPIPVKPSYEKSDKTFLSDFILHLVLSGNYLYEGWIFSSSSIGWKKSIFSASSTIVPNTICFSKKISFWEPMFNLFLGTNQGVYSNNCRAAGMPIINKNQTFSHSSSIAYSIDGNSLHIIYNAISYGMITIEIFNSAGKIVSQTQKVSCKEGKNRYTVERFMDNWSQGVYFVKTLHGNIELCKQIVAVKK